MRNSERVGARNPNAKMNDATVKMLREYRAGGWSHKDLALLFGISESRSSEICQGKGYPNAGGPITGRKRALYFSSVHTRREKLNPYLADLIYQGNSEGMTHGKIQELVKDKTGVEISKSLIGLVLRGKTKY